ncbi:MAG: hypothetical protein J7599_03700 [Niabella sp.]|nr:hypothetical protein [Niabella sp.]
MQSVYWVNWDLNNDGRPGDGIPDNTTRTVTTPQGVVYTIRITKINGNTNNLQSYVSGQWAYDDMKTGYNWFTQAVNNANQYTGSYNYTTGNITQVYDNLTDAHNSVVGIRNTVDGQAVNFRVSVTARLGNTVVKIPGMLAVGAESLGSSPVSPYREYERFTAGNSGGGTATPWQVFDKVQNAYTGSARSTSFNTVADVSDQGRTVLLRNPASTGEGPGEVIWFAHGADQIDVLLKGGGAQAIAIGFLVTYDFGDAPQSYGLTSHSLDLSFSGGTPPVQNNVRLSGISEATKNAPGFVIGTRADDEPGQLYSGDLFGDDKNNEADEDGLPNPYKSSIVVGARGATIRVPVKNNSGTAGSLTGWIDINQNGFFEPAERSNAAAVPDGTSGEVTIQFANLAEPFAAFTNYPMRIRLAQALLTDDASTGMDESAAGPGVGGEVEDHMARVQDAAVSGTLFKDANGNGLQDPGENGYNGDSGMFVYLLDGNGKIVGKSALVNGQYSISGIPVNGDLSALNIRLMVSSQSLDSGTVVTDPAGVAPDGYRNSGEDLSAAGSNVNNHNNNTDFVVQFTGVVPETGIQEVNFGISPLALAVSFGSIQATITGNILKVSWVTETEEHNDHFDIEISTDGTRFVKWATVRSKAPDGVSNRPIHYTVEGKSQSEVPATASLFFIAIVLAMSLKVRARNLRLFICCAGLMGAGISCSKKELPERTASRVYVRIVQYDKNDAAPTYSKVIQATVED